jgi:formate dehydrogenase alpha subunit
MTNSIGEIAGTDCVVVMGSNTTSQHPMIASKVMKAKQSGAKLIVIDPRRIPIVEYADLFLQIKAGTNIALLNGFLNHLIQNGLIDEPFIRERTEGFKEVKAKVKAYPLEKVSEISGIAVELLKEAAEVYGKADKAMILYAMGITQHLTGTDNVKAVANLAMATGNIGRPSTGVNPLRGQNNVQGACDMGALPNVVTGYQQVADLAVRERFKSKWGLDVPHRPGLTVVEMLDAANKGSIKGMMIVGENPMISDPDITHVKEALQSLDFLVVQDIFMTETAKFAHVILPACSFAEKEGTFTNTDRRVQRIRKAIEPVGESKPDWQIISELTREMEFEGFNYPSAQEIMNEITSLTPSYGGISYNRLDRGEVLHWPCPDEDHPGTPFLHERGFVRGKGLFSAVDYIPPSEMPDEEYPYLLNTGRVPFHFHGGSMTRRIEKLNKEVPTGYVDINPDDAGMLSIEEGDSLRVTSRRGGISIKARLTDAVEPGTVFIPMHFSECAVNILTDTKLDSQAKIPGFKVCAVRLEKEN